MLRSLHRLAVPLALALTVAQAQDDTVAENELAARADDFLTRCAAFGFSGAVLVEKDGELLLEKGYGAADRTTGTPNTSATLFDVGSLTKQFTAAAILCLEQEGRLKTTDTLAKFFDDVPRDKAKIQLHHLLTHTSGLPRGHREIASALTDRAKFLEILLGCELQSKPGSEHVYSNIGYDLLAAVVEVVTEAPFEDYLRSHLFEPAGMADTGFRQDGSLDADRAASGHPLLDDATLPGSSIQGPVESPWEKRLATDGWYSWGLRGAGGVITTTGDLRRWSHALFETEDILTEKSRRKLLKPARDDYAYGWYVLETDRGTTWIEHGGSTGNGFDVKFSRFPDEGLLVVTLGNVSGVVPWVNQNLIRLLVGEEAAAPPATLAVADVERWAGAYEGKDGERFELRPQNGGLLLEATNPEALARLLPIPRDWAREAEELLEKTARVAEGLAANDPAPLHALEARPLFYFDGWWQRLQQTHGPLVEQRVLGAQFASGVPSSTLLRLDFERGAEILELGWVAGEIVSTLIGPPYPSMMLLRPTSDASFVRYDLRRSEVTARATFGAEGRLTLELEDTELELSRAR